MSRQRYGVGRDVARALSYLQDPMKLLLSRTFAALTALTLTLATSTAQSQVTNAAIGAFPVGPAQVTFTGLANGTELNGATIGGVLFAYSLGNGKIAVGAGPGNTNNITSPDLESIGEGNNSGVLSLTLPTFANLFGFGYALRGTGTILNATTVTAFSGATNLGSLSYNGVLDPIFPGGFAGLQSTTAFNRLELTFNSTQATAFALDNIRFTSVVPEPSSLLLVAMGIGALALVGRRRASRS